MNAQREGTNLKISIRLARLALGQDPHQPIKGTIAAMREQLRELHRQVRLAREGGQS